MWLKQLRKKTEKSLGGDQPPASYRQYVCGKKLAFAPFPFLPALRKLKMAIAPNSDLTTAEGHTTVGGTLHNSTLVVL